MLPVPVGTGITGQHLISSMPEVLMPLGLNASHEVGRYLNDSLPGLHGSCFTYLDDDHIGVFPHKPPPFISSDRACFHGAVSSIP